MKFSSIQEIVDVLRLDAPASDLTAIRRELRSRRAAIHPDRLSGREQSKDEEAEWRALEAAVEFINSCTSDSTAMIKLDDLQHITDTLAASLAIIQKPEVEARQERAIERSRQSIQQRYIVPKLTASVLAGILGVLLAIIGTVQSSTLFRVPLERVPLRVDHSLLWRIGTAVEKLERAVDEYLAGHGPEIPAREADGLTTAIATFRIGYQAPVVPTWLSHYSAYGSQDSLHYLQRHFYDVYGDDVFPAESDLAVSQIDQLRTEVYRYAQAVPLVDPDSLEAFGDIRKLAHSLRRDLGDLQVLLGKAYRDRADLRQRLVNHRKAQALYALWTLFGSMILVLSIVWLRERSDQRWIEFLATEMAPRMFLQNLASRHYDGPGRPSRPFTRAEFAVIVSRKATPRLLRPVLGVHLDPARIAGVVTTLLERMIQRGWIRRMPDEDLTELYSVSRIAMMAVRESVDAAIA